MYRHIISTLFQEIGWSFPVILISGSLRKNGIFNQTRWAQNPDLKTEAAYVKRLSFAAAIYLSICERVGKDKAFQIVRKVLVPIGCDTVRKRLNALDLSGLHGMERLMKFNHFMQTNDEAKYNLREYVVTDHQTCHYVIKRCVVHDFFTEAGTPELTRLICEVDQVFFPEAFPDFLFDRGDSWENTMAYGKKHCDFILKIKQ